MSPKKRPPVSLAELQRRELQALRDQVAYLQKANTDMLMEAVRLHDRLERLESR
jgi:hypothetical protein